MDIEGPDQPALMRRLIKAFAVRKQNHWILENVSMKSECPEKTLHDDVNPHILRMLKGTFSLEAAHIVYIC